MGHSPTDVITGACFICLSGKRFGVFRCAADGRNLNVGSIRGEDSDVYGASSCRTHDSVAMGAIADSHDGRLVGDVTAAVAVFERAGEDGQLVLKHKGG